MDLFQFEENWRKNEQKITFSQMMKVEEDGVFLFNGFPSELKAHWIRARLRCFSLTGSDI